MIYFTFSFRIDKAVEGDWDDFTSDEKETLHFTRNLAGDTDNQLAEMARKMLALYNVYLKSVTISLADTKAMAHEIVDGIKSVEMITDIWRNNRNTKPVSEDALIQFMTGKGATLSFSQSVRILPFAYVDPSATMGKNIVVGMGAFVGRESRIRNNVTLCNHVSVPPKTEVEANTIIIDEPDTFELTGMIKDFEELLSTNKDTLNLKVNALIENKAE